MELEVFICDSLNKTKWEKFHAPGLRENSYRREIEVMLSPSNSLTITEYSDQPGDYCISSECGYVGINNSMEMVMEFISDNIKIEWERVK